MLTATGLVVTCLILIAAATVLSLHRPGLDKSGNALKPQRAEAETTLDEIKSEVMGLPPDPLWLIVSGRNEAEVYQRLQLSEKLLNAAASNHVIGKPELPTALWPRPDFQAANRAAATVLGRQGPLLRETALDAGFNTNALVLTDELVRTWARAGASTNVLWPTNSLAQWLLERFRARTPDEWLVMGTVSPPTNHVENAALAQLSSQLAGSQVFLSGWELLGSTTLKRVQAKLWQLVAPMVVLVLASLWFAFRRPTEILLGVAVLLLSGVFLLALMAVAGWSWNLLNLMALPLMLGTGVDYTHLHPACLAPAWRRPGACPALRRPRADAVRRHGHGRIRVAGVFQQSRHGQPRQGVRRGHRRQHADLGVPAAGVVALCFSPKSKVQSRESVVSSQWSVAEDAQGSSIHAPRTTHHAPRHSSPSSFYRAGLWHLGLMLVHICPPALVKALCTLVAEFYCRVQRGRREVVVQNLLPAFGGDRQAAKEARIGSIGNSPRKLVDLWRVESGAPVQNWLTNPR